MDDTELREALERLHQELEENEHLDDEERQQLEHLMGHIRTALDREEASSDEDYDSLVEQLNEGVQRYQASHPGLTSTMMHVLDILSGAGI
jgi:hypothetical protein